MRRWIVCGVVAVAIASVSIYAIRLRSTRAEVRPSVPAAGQWTKFRTLDSNFENRGLKLRGTLYVPETSGRSPGIVFLHGRSLYGRRQSLYLILCQELAARGYAVQSFDFRGFGQSEDPPKVTSPADLDFAGDAKRAIDVLVAQPSVDRNRLYLVGHSFGAGVAIAAGVEDPRISRIVSISPPRRSIEEQLGEDATHKSAAENMMEDAIRGHLDLPKEILYPVMRSLLPDILLEHRVHPPILFVDGANEDRDDRQFLQDLYSRITEPKSYATISGAEHFFGTHRIWKGRREPGSYDAKIVSDLVGAIDAWLRG